MGKGGAERVISILGKHYAEKGWRVSIAMLLHNIIEYTLPPEINTINLSDKRGIKIGFNKVISKLKRLVESEKPDVVIAFMAQNILLTWIAIKGKEVPFIVSERIDPAQVKRNLIFKRVLNKIYKKASIVVFQTRRAQEYFDEEIQSNSRIISNPINVLTKKTPNPEHKIVSVGRMTEQKNQSMLIKVFKSIHDKYPNYKLIIYGDGPLRDVLEAETKKLKLCDSVYLPGISNNIHEDISDAEMFVLPSNYEGLSNALMEAMSMGLPSISTNCAGSDEIIENGKNGLLVPVGDEKKLYDAIERLILDKELRETISKESSKSMVKYSAQNIIRLWDETIEKVMAKEESCK